VSGSGISWAICKSAPRSRQITTPVPHHSVFYRPDALPAAQPTASSTVCKNRAVKVEHICFYIASLKIIRHYCCAVLVSCKRYLILIISGKLAQYYFGTWQSKVSSFSYVICFDTRQNMLGNVTFHPDVVVTNIVKI